MQTEFRQEDPMRKTKIVCTLGPATDNEDVLRQMMLAGMNVARCNFSHATYDEHKKRMDMIKKLRKEVGQPVAILLDTKGPEVRVKNFKDGRVTLEDGQLFTLTADEVEGTKDKVSVTYNRLYEDLEVGMRVLIDDGLIEMQVEQVDRTNIVCRVINGGTVSNHKGVNVPDVDLSMPYISDKDREDILFGISQDVDFIAASFVQKKEDILQLRRLLEKNGGSDIKIIAKIENAQGVTNIDDIIEVSDGIMVARGDMGVEIPYEEVPVIQKKIIKKVYRTGKQVITATQMLESMIKNPRPTRAETTDVANAVYDGTSAIMLSGETAGRLLSGGSREDHGADRRAHGTGRRLPQTLLPELPRDRYRHHQCHLPRLLHHRTGPERQSHRDRHQVRHLGQNARQIPPRERHHQLRHHGEGMPPAVLNLGCYPHRHQGRKGSLQPF